MIQQWLGPGLLYCEKQPKRVNGFQWTAQVIGTIKAEQAEQQPALTQQAA
jgi:hypothetical protein